MQLRENVCFFLPFNYIEYSSEWNEKKKQWNERVCGVTIERAYAGACGAVE